MNGLTVQNPSGAIQQVPNPVNIATVTQAGAGGAGGGPSVTLWGTILGDILQQIDLQQQFALKAGIAELNAHISDHNNPHHVNQAQVGLSNVDNTADINKPLSGPQAAAITAALTGPVPTIQIQSSQISDSTSSGRSVLTAANALAQRTALGSGATGDTVFTAATPAAARAALVVSAQPTFRNMLDNARFIINQRKLTSVSTGSGGNYVVDRWQLASAGTARMTGAVSNASLNPGQFVNLLGTVTVSGAPAAGDAMVWQQGIEGYTLLPALYGTANARQLAATFEVYSSVPGTYCVSLGDYAATRSYVAPFTINAANTWETKTILIPGDTAGSNWVSNTVNGVMHFQIAPVVGSTFQTATPNTWINGYFLGTTTQTQLSATAAATFRLGRCQLEFDTATPFEVLLTSVDQDRCMQFLHVLLPSGSSSVAANAQASTFAANSWQMFIPHYPPMRTTPFMNFNAAAGTYTITHSAGTQSVINFTNGVNQLNMSTLNITTSGAGQTGGTTGYLSGTNTTAEVYYDSQTL